MSPPCHGYFDELVVNAETSKTDKSDGGDDSKTDADNASAKDQPTDDQPIDKGPGGQASSGAALDAVPAVVKLLSGVDRFFGLVEQTVLVLLLLVLIGVGAGQAVATKFDTSWPWSFELIRYSVFFIAMTGAALSAHTQQLIAMDFVTRMLAPRGRARLKIILRLFTVFVCILLVKGGLLLSDAASATLYHVVNPRHGLLALPIGAGLIALHVTLHLVIDVIYLLGGRVPPGEVGAPGSVH